jgi:hypothetical protein
MRTDWVPLSASALVIGAMSLVLGSAMNPAEAGSTSAQTVQIATDQGTRWLAMAVMYSIASLALVLGLPALLSLVPDRGNRLGMAGASIFCVGALGTCSYAMLLVYFRALVAADAVDNSAVATVAHDPGVVLFLGIWIGSFHLGVLLLAASLLVARTTARWVPLLMIAFLVLVPVASQLGRVGAAMQVMLLAVAFTGAAMAAVSRRDQAVPGHSPAY